MSWDYTYVLLFFDTSDASVIWEYRWGISNDTSYFWLTYDGHLMSYLEDWHDGHTPERTEGELVCLVRHWSKHVTTLFLALVKRSSDVGTQMFVVPGTWHGEIMFHVHVSMKSQKLGRRKAKKQCTRIAETTAPKFAERFWEHMWFRDPSAA